MSKLIFTNKVAQALDSFAEAMQPASTVVVADTNTELLVLPRIKAESVTVANAYIVTVRSGEMNKNIDALTALWRRLGDAGVTRHSLIINLGGGLVSDLGGFAASTFKRGVQFVNIPTTLLGAIDASYGGKTGINFNNLKNEVGTFTEPELVIVSTIFFRTLTDQEMLSGYAEMVKHALLSSKEMLHDVMDYDIANYTDDTLLTLMERCVEVKRHFVDADLREAGLRKALNLGHTAGHAFEELALQRKSPLPHGYAVAFGLIVALVLSRMKLDFPSDTLQQYGAFVRERYGAFEISCEDYPKLLDAMHHDKKNRNTGEILCTLLRKIGEPLINQPVSDADMTAALDIYRDMLSL